MLTGVTRFPGLGPLVALATKRVGTLTKGRLESRGYRPAKDWAVRRGGSTRSRRLNSRRTLRVPRVSRCKIRWGAWAALASPLRATVGFARNGNEAIPPGASVAGSVWLARTVT